MYLVEKWQKMLEELIDFDDSKFDLKDFKLLFAESWRYLSEQNCECGLISLEAAEILGYIKVFQTFPFYPSGITKAVICAVNHNGDSDSTGSLTGNILGAYLGMFNIDCTGKFYMKPELYDVMFEIAQDLALVSQLYDCSEYKNAKWFSKYILQLRKIRSKSYEY